MSRETQETVNAWAVETPERRVGDWMQVASGKRFYPFDPRTEEINITDIAAALAKLCRFGGHVRDYYSVAEHSVRVSYVCDPADALWGLLHDASEAYLCDLPRPIKRHRYFSDYRHVEERLMWRVCERFRLPAQVGGGGLLRLPPAVHRADEILLATEARDLMGVADASSWASLPGIEPLPERIRPWPWQDAEARFLLRFYELAKGGAA